MPLVTHGNAKDANLGCGSCKNLIEQKGSCLKQNILSFLFLIPKNARLCTILARRSGALLVHLPPVLCLGWHSAQQEPPAAALQQALCPGERSQPRQARNERCEERQGKLYIVASSTYRPQTLLICHVWSETSLLQWHWQ